MKIENVMEEMKIETGFSPFIKEYIEVTKKYYNLLLFCFHMVILFNHLLTYPKFRKQGVHFSGHYSLYSMVTTENNL